MCRKGESEFRAVPLKVSKGENKMNRLKNIITLFAFSLLVLGVPTLASAQWRDRNNRDDDYNRNGNYNRNINSTVKNLKNRSKQFERRLDRELDRSRYDDRRREDNLNNLADRFARAADDLDDAYDNNRDYNRSSDEARRVLELGSQLDRALSRTRLNSNVSNDWNRIRQDLSVLANAYGYYNNNNRNNRNTRNSRNGDWRNSLPFPFPF